MTQSGQGEEPSARQAREGIVLPSDGGEPVVPGAAGGPAGGPGGRGPGPQPAGQSPASAPAGGQTWGGAWGPGEQQGPPPGHGHQPSPQQWDAPDAWGAQQPASRPGPGPLPPEGGHPRSGYAPAGHPAPQAGPGGYGAPGGGSAPMPPAVQPYPDSGAYGAPQPPAGQQTGGYGSAVPGAPSYPAPGGPGPLPPADDGATQYLPPVADHGGEQATQYLPPVPAADDGATQYIPPVRAGALPPEMPAETDAESTRYLGRAPRGGTGAGAGPLPSAGHPDAEATQYIAPVADQAAAAPYGVRPGGGDRQPPAEFDNLFRADAGGEGPAATQQLPRFDEPPAPSGHRAQPSYAPPGDGGGRGRGRGGRGGRSGSRVPVIAVVGVALAALGVGAGALLAGGEGGDEGEDGQTVSASAPADSASASASASPSADPARQQAADLDALLADSGDSRTSVINAVADVRACRNLAQAAEDLRDAAGQRKQLVTDLSGLAVDRLPRHAELTSALTKAWQASESADNHYAAWADQVAAKKGSLCKKGQARSTAQTQAGNRASGTATTEKAKAARLWNAIAKQYGLTERQPTQL
ncbi:hypothetical protein ACIF8T_12995 [Streptomyces sp. NPDC085946]|uniref:hypothetical protein n=1 Tax=Streptomyces sp. NPDC085946 TaxID=3365744 RepID=UPI0037CD415A